MGRSVFIGGALLESGSSSSDNNNNKKNKKFSYCLNHLDFEDRQGEFE